MVELTVSQKIEQAMKTAARARSADLATLRLLKAALQNEAIAFRGKGQTLTATDELTVVRRELKRRQEAAELYKNNNRPELAAREEAETKVLRRYLPPPPAIEEVRQTVKNLQQQLVLSGPAAAGQLIKAVLGYYQGAVDGSTVSQEVRRILTPDSQ